MLRNSILASNKPWGVHLLGTATLTIAASAPGDNPSSSGVVFTFAANPRFFGSGPTAYALRADSPYIDRVPASLTTSYNDVTRPPTKADLGA